MPSGIVTSFTTLALEQPKLPSPVTSVDFGVGVAALTAPPAAFGSAVTLGWAVELAIGVMLGARVGVG